MKALARHSPRPEGASRFTYRFEGRLEAHCRDFLGADIALAAVPLDLQEASGEWRFADGRLLLDNGSFMLRDRDRRAVRTRSAQCRAGPGRQPHHRAGRAQSERPAGHRCRGSASGGGRDADLDIGVRFDEALQPLDVAAGQGRGGKCRGRRYRTGAVAWRDGEVTARGNSPARASICRGIRAGQGASGTIEFTDLLGLPPAGPLRRLGQSGMEWPTAGRFRAAQWRGTRGYGRKLAFHGRRTDPRGRPQPGGQRGATYSRSSGSMPAPS